MKVRNIESGLAWIGAMVVLIGVSFAAGTAFGSEAAVTAAGVQHRRDGAGLLEQACPSRPWAAAGRGGPRRPGVRRIGSRRAADAEHPGDGFGVGLVRQRRPGGLQPGR